MLEGKMDIDHRLVKSALLDLMGFQEDAWSVYKCVYVFVKITDITSNDLMTESTSPDFGQPDADRHDTE